MSLQAGFLVVILLLAIFAFIVVVLATVKVPKKLGTITHLKHSFITVEGIMVARLFWTGVTDSRVTTVTIMVERNGGEPGAFGTVGPDALEVQVPVVPGEHIEWWGISNDSGLPPQESAHDVFDVAAVPLPLGVITNLQHELQP